MKNLSFPGKSREMFEDLRAPFADIGIHKKKVAS